MKKNPSIWLWLIVLLAPLLMILSSFIFGQWTWGLMDDHGFELNIAQPHILDAFSNIAGGYGSGRGARFTYELYKQIFYYIFKDHPAGFYFFHALFFSGIFLIWGYAAFLCTQEMLSLFLVPVIAMGCKPLYEGFFYLSIQELLGLFFMGLALVFLTRIFLAYEKDRKALPWDVGAALLSVFFMLGSKETFVAPLLVLSSAFFIRACLARWRVMIIGMGAMTSLTISYALWLKFFVQNGYSSSYSYFDVPHLIVNIQAWFSDVFTGHLPWICLLIFLLFRFRTESRSWATKNALYLALGITSYLLYLLIILPWRGMSYMAIPLGIFFAFTMGMILAPLLVRLSNRWHIFLSCGFLILNMLLASHQLISFAQYNHDTIDLLKWIKNDPYLQFANAAGKHFGCNATEPSDAITDLVKIIDKKQIQPVRCVPVVRDILSDKDMLFYFYLTRYGDQDLSRLGDMWTAVFVSESWVVFRRNY